MKSKNLNVKVPADLLEAAKRKAKAEDVTVSQVVRRALREFVGDECQAVHGKIADRDGGS